MEPRLRALLSCAAMLLAAACGTVPPPAPGLVPRPVAEVQRWEILQQGQRVGWLLLLEIQDAVGPLRFYRVENQRGQWLGHATLQGRFSRRVPFHDDEEDLGLHGLAQGVARLLDLQALPSLAAWKEPQVLDAAAPKDHR